MNTTLTFWSNDDLPFDCPSGCGCLQPDPDIAGIGVIAAFVTGSGLTVLASFVGLWLDLKRPKPSLLGGNPINENRVDRLVNRWLPDPFSSRQKEFWFEVFYAVVLSLSDTQLVSGLAVISTALIRMSNGNLSTYHFWIIQDLAWLANNSHTLSLEVIRRWLGDKQGSSSTPASTNTPKRGPYFLLRSVRLMLMFLMFGLMLTMAIFAGGRWADYYWNCPANCIAYRYPGSTDGTGSLPGRWMIVNIALLVWAYAGAIVYLLGPTARIWQSTKGWVKPTVTKMFGGSMIEVLMWVWDWLGSSLFETMFQIVWFVLGVYWLVIDWQSGQTMLKHPDDVVDYLQCDPVPEGETGWGFGQIFPIFMLLLPLMAMLEAYEDAKESEKTEKMRQHCNSCGSTSVPVTSIKLHPLPVHVQTTP